MKIVCMFLLAAALTACNGASQKKNNTAEAAAATETVAAETTKAVSATDYFGTYEGVIPAADCEGIKTVLTINEDTTYKLVSEALGEKEAEGEGAVETNGTYNVIENGLIELVRPSSGDKTYYKIVEGKGLMLSDEAGTINEGELSEYYILKRK